MLFSPLLNVSTSQNKHFYVIIRMMIKNYSHDAKKNQWVQKIKQNFY